MRQAYGAAVALFAVTLPAAGAERDDYRLRYQVPPTPARACGVDCLYTCLRALGNEGLSLADLEKQLPPGPQGVSLESIRSVCRANGVRATPVRTDLNQLKAITNPVILHVNDSHYLALLGWEDGRMIVFDNVVGVYDCTPERWSSWYEWGGTALILGTPPPRVVLSLYGPSLLLAAGGVGLLGLIVARIRRPRSALP